MTTRTKELCGKLNAMRKKLWRQRVLRVAKAHALAKNFFATKCEEGVKLKYFRGWKDFSSIIKRTRRKFFTECTKLIHRKMKLALGIWR